MRLDALRLLAPLLLLASVTAAITKEERLKGQQQAYLAKPVPRDIGSTLRGLLWSRQASCTNGTSCLGQCISSNEVCCRTGSCIAGMACCGDGCVPHAAFCCSNGNYCTVAGCCDDGGTTIPNFPVDNDGDGSEATGTGAEPTIAVPSVEAPPAVPTDDGSAQGACDAKVQKVLLGAGAAFKGGHGGHGDDGGGGSSGGTKTGNGGCGGGATSLTALGGLIGLSAISALLLL